MLLDELKADIITSLKKGDSVRVETLRFLLAAIVNLAIDKYGAAGEASLTEADILDVIKKQVKTHKESVEAFTKAGRGDLVDKEQAQMVILQSFLPEEMSDEELKKLLEPIIKSGESHFGKLMGQAMGIVKGKVDGGRVAAILKEML